MQHIKGQTNKVKCWIKLNDGETYLMYEKQKDKIAAHIHLYLRNFSVTFFKGQPYLYLYLNTYQGLIYGWFGTNIFQRR